MEEMSKYKIVVPDATILGIHEGDTYKDNEEKLIGATGTIHIVRVFDIKDNNEMDGPWVAGKFILDKPRTLTMNAGDIEVSDLELFAAKIDRIQKIQ